MHMYILMYIYRYIHIYIYVCAHCAYKNISTDTHTHTCSERSFRIGMWNVSNVQNNPVYLTGVRECELEADPAH